MKSRSMRLASLSFFNELAMSLWPPANDENYLYFRSLRYAPCAMPYAISQVNEVVLFKSLPCIDTGLRILGCEFWI